VKFVSKFQYLGVIISDDLTDDDDIECEIVVCILGLKELMCK